jgi:tetratricopeptide (TPR) repeat protein
MRDFKHAEEDLKKAKRLLSGQPRPYEKYLLHVNDGIVRYQRGRKDEAIECFKDAIADAIALQLTGLYQADQNLARVLIEQGNLPDALEQLDRAIQQDPKQPDLLRDRAHVRVTLGRFQDALNDIDQAIQLDPEGERAAEDREFWGEIKRRMGERRESPSP